MPHAGGLYYEDHGPPGAEPLILSSGLGGSAGYWGPNLAALAERHRVIVYDHRGTGRSDRTVEGDLTLEAAGDDIVALMDALDIPRATLIGHAIGGMMGLAVALKHPGRLSRIVVINGWARLDPYTARCFDTRLVLLRESPRAFVHGQPIFLFPAQWMSDHHARLEAEEEVHLAHFPCAEMVGRRIAAARRFNIADRLGEIDAQVLLIATEDDMLVPSSCSEKLAKGIPGAQLAKLATGAHAVNVTRADHFNMWLLDWLDGE
jgi:aminoacrylate hydrolase